MLVGAKQLLARSLASGARKAIPQKQPPRGRLWLNDGSCMRLRATYPNHVWNYDFVLIRDAYGGKIHMLTMIDEFSRKCLSIHCARRIGSIQVIEQLANAMVIHGIPEYIRSDNVLNANTFSSVRQSHSITANCSQKIKFTYDATQTVTSTTCQAA